MEERVRLWWQIFSHDAFPLLVPLRRWRQAGMELDLGAIVLVRYEAKFSRDRFRLGRVLGLEKSRDGLVRTALVGLRNLV